MDTATSTREEQQAEIERRVHPVLVQYALSGGTATELSAFGLKWVSDRMREVSSNINKLSDNLISKIHATFSSNPTLGEEIIHVVIDRSQSTSIQDYLIFRPVMPHVENPHQFIKPLHHYPQLSRVKDYAECDPLITEKAAALVAVAAHLFEYRYLISPAKTLSYVDNGVILSNAQLIQLVLDHPHQAQQIAEAIVERRSVDINVIQSIIKTGTSSLSRGIL